MAIHPSQQEEEKLVREFFQNDDSGFYVEVGANHPTDGSQTWHLEQHGWTGVLVEPQPDLAAFLVTMRKTAKVFPVACTSPDNAGQMMSLHVDGARSGLDRDRMAPGSNTSFVIAVPTRTLDSILEEAQAPSPIDLLSVDVEGHELEVLSGFDFERWQPLLILRRRPCRHASDAPVSQGARLPADPPLRQQRLVCVRRSQGQRVARRPFRDPAQVLSRAAVSHAAQLVAADSRGLRRSVGGEVADVAAWSGRFMCRYRSLDFGRVRRRHRARPVAGHHPDRDRRSCEPVAAVGKMHDARAGERSRPRRFRRLRA